MSADQTPANRARVDSADLDSAESATAGGAHGAGESSELSNESPSGHGAAVGQTAATAGSDRTVASAWSLPGAYRLGILQILVWTLLSALLASLVQPGFASTPTPTSFEWHYRVFCTAHAILVGGILTAAGTLVVGRQRGQIPYWHPGHWFLIASLLGESIVLLVRLIEHWMVGTYLGYSMQLLQVLGYIPVLLVYAMALFTRDRVVWRVAFGLSLALIMAKLSALAVFLPIGIFRMFGFVEWLQWFGLLFVTITLIIAMVTDIQEKVPRDGLHWAGAVSALLGKCLLIYWFIAV